MYAPIRQMHAHLQSNSELANERSNEGFMRSFDYIMRTLIHYRIAHHLNHCFNVLMKLELQTADYMNATVFAHLHDTK